MYVEVKISWKSFVNFLKCTQGKYLTLKWKKFLIKEQQQSEQQFLIKEQQQSYENDKICYVRKEKFENEYLKDKKYRKVRDHCHYAGKYRGAAHYLFRKKH